jgi:cation diffusion facilitator family transporter
LVISFALIVTFSVVQVVVGLVTDSLALLSDAGHMATDALGLGMALAAIQAASNARSHPQRTFGLYRLEILAALFNAMLLFAVAGYVLFEAVRRISDAPDIASGPVLVVGVIGLVVNLAAFALLRSGAKDSLNVRGAYLEVVSDTLGSVGVIVGAIVWGITGWTWVRPGHRRGDRCVHPSASVAARPRSTERVAAGRTGPSRHDCIARRAGCDLRVVDVHDNPRLDSRRRRWMWPRYT